MKHLSYLKILSSFLSFFFVSNMLIGQFAISTRHQTQETQYSLVQEGCQYKVCFSTYIYSPYGHPFSGESLDPNPPQIDDMYLDIDIMGQSTTHLLTEWVEEVDAVHHSLQDSSGYAIELTGIYKSSICMTLDLVEECIEEDNNDIEGKPNDSDLIYIPYTLEILTLNESGVYEPYNICDHIGPYGMFSCEMFSFTEELCDNPDDCINEELYAYTGELEISCNECILYLDEFSLRNKDDEKLNSVSNIKVTPNPFTSQVDIQSLPNNIEKRISIYNAIGQIVTSFKTEKTDVTFDTENLEIGVYFINVEFENEIRNFKVIKI